MDDVCATVGRLRLFSLSPHLPERNPDELLWSQLKSHGIGTRIAYPREQMR